MNLYILKYSGIIAKTRVMTGRLLKKEDYDQLITKKSVGSVSEYLKHTENYSRVLEGISENSIHRGQLERILRNTLFEDYLKFFKFLHGDIKKFLKILFSRNEIEDIKILIRMLKDERSTSLEGLPFLKQYSTVDLEKLAASKDIQQFVSNLEGSKYHRMLSPFLTSEERLDLFRVEMTLDMYFFYNIWKEKDKLLRGADKEMCENFLGSEGDILNILWIYRSKKYYNIPNELIYTFIIPTYYRIKKDTIIEMVKSQTTEQIQKIVERTKYAEIFSQEAFSADGKFFEERGFSIYIYKMHKKNILNNSFSVSHVMSYLYLRQEEIRNIISIIEGIRYNLSPAEIQKYIIGA